MASFKRRDILNMAAALPLAAVSRFNLAAETKTMFVCMHQQSSIGFDFRTCMEGWAKAGIQAVEPDLDKAREYAEKQGSPLAVKALLDDLGLTPVSSTNQLFLEETHPQRAQAIEDLKWKVELCEAMGVDRIVAPSAAEKPHTMDDYPEVIDNLLEAAEIARPHHVTLMLEFTRLSTLVNNLRTAIWVVRTANHPNLRLMLDVYHFWAGMSKFEDLELLERGELHHVHFEDTPAYPHYETFERKHRAYPGEGIAPLARIVEVLKRKGYSGPASLEMFDPVIQNTDPYEVAVKARQTMEPFLI